MLAFLSPLLLFCAFVLLLLVSLSVPIIKEILLFTLTARVSTTVGNLGDASVSGIAKFGVWGYCVTSFDATIFGQDIPSREAICSAKHLGLEIDSTIAQVLQISQNDQNLIKKGSTAAFVLHPIACGLTFLVFLISIFMLKRSNRIPALWTLILGLITTILTTIVFLVDIIVVALVRKRIRDETDGDVTLAFGNGIWMVLGAAIASWLAMFVAMFAVCGCCGRRSGKSERF